MTRLGIKTSVLAALMCVVGLVSGYVGALLLAGYILLAEKDHSLRTTAIKTLIVMVLASVGLLAINLLPETIGLVSSLLSIFNGSLYIGVLSSICNFLRSVVEYAETIVLLAMAIGALKGKELFKISFVDKLVGECSAQTEE